MKLDIKVEVTVNGVKKECDIQVELQDHHGPELVDVTARSAFDRCMSSFTPAPRAPQSEDQDASQ